MTDASGNRLQTNAYDEYGVPRTTASTNPEPYGRFAYTGQIWLPEVKLYHYKARIYSPTLGRFLQTDPVGYDDQVNLYAYVGNDPMNKEDPSGNQAIQDMQTQSQVEDLRAQGVSERSILTTIGEQAKAEGTALSTYATIAGAPATVGALGIQGTFKLVVSGGSIGGLASFGAALLTGKDPAKEGLKGLVGGAATAVTTGGAKGRATSSVAVANSTYVTSRAQGDSRLSAGIAASLAGGVQAVTNNSEAATATGQGVRGFIKSVGKDTLTNYIAGKLESWFGN